MKGKLKREKERKKNWMNGDRMEKMEWLMEMSKRLIEIGGKKNSK